MEALFLEARLALMLLTLQRGLEEGAGPELEAAGLLWVVRQAAGRLRSMGYTDAEILGAHSAERLRVSRSLRVTLPGRGGQELHLAPLQRTVFIFFLKHPEGVTFKELSSYRNELEQLYGIISPRTSKEGVRATIGRLIDPVDGSVNVVRTRLQRALEACFGAAEAAQYSISGRSGEPKGIPLDRTLVEWD